MCSPSTGCALTRFITKVRGGEKLSDCEIYRGSGKRVSNDEQKDDEYEGRKTVMRVPS
jgi:hypothetical protein